ncbi:MAG: pyridine nucleotide-disulfide oxidoreductase [Desulfobacteraceae bacterium]|nr:MAG: pyridine nucleotide-disulfide oxidoreductase [Desulfobacteraceae bacterium]
MKFLVIGGDAAGMSAASRAKRNMPDLEVTVLEMTEDVSYSACGMPYNIADSKREIDDLVVRAAKVFREKQDINLLTGHRVTFINPSGKTVSGRTRQGKTFEFSYDKLLIATGGRAVVPDLPGMDHPGIHVLKSLEDGRKIKAYIREKQVKKAVIIGMGYIGLEMCEALRELSVQVDMVKPGPVFLPWMAQELSESIQAELVSHDVGMHAGHAVERIEPDGNHIRVICTGLTLDADMVLLAMGISPSSELAENAGLRTSVGNSIAVDRTLKTSDENIYAAGDCADAYHMVTGRKTWIPLALRANRAGWAVADNVCGKSTELPGIAGTAVFKVFNKEVARTGLTIKEAETFSFDPASVTISSRSRAHAHPGSTTILVHMVGDRKTGRLLGVQMVGNEGVAHRINAAAVALHNRMTVEAFSQTDLAYAPPFGPVWDPLLTAANQLLKKMEN